MNLIDIGYPNVLINPNNIDYIEQRVVGIASVTYICVGGKEFMLGITLDELWGKLGIANTSEGGQYFAG